MRNKWIKIILVSAIIFVMELICVMLYLRPYIIRYRVFCDIEDGDIIRLQKNYEKLDDVSKKKVDENVDAYAFWLVERYFDEKIDYDRAADAIYAIKAVLPNYADCNRYAAMVNSKELVDTITRLQKAELNKDADGIYKGQDTINKLVLRMDNGTREDIMISLLCDKYKRYLNEKLTPEAMKVYSYLVRDMSYYSAYDLSKRIYDNIACVEWYKEAYKKADELSTKKNYIGALRLMNRIQIDSSDKKYKKKYKTLYKNTYALGEIYYNSLFEKYISMNDNESVLLLLAELSDVYKDSFDVGGFETQVASAWQKAYIAFVENWETVLKNDLQDTETGQYIMENLYDSVWPDSICMFDVDDDGTPEAFLYNSDRIDDDYVECFMYNYNGETVEYMGYVNVISFCVNSNLITFPKAFDRESGEEYALTAYDGSMIGTMTYCQSIDGEYFVDGEDAADYEFLAKKTDILQYQSRYNISNVEHSSLDDAKSFILTYK